VRDPKGAKPHLYGVNIQGCYFELGNRGGYFASSKYEKAAFEAKSKKLTKNKSRTIYVHLRLQGAFSNISMGIRRKCT